jgi:hypothetical protein
MAREPLDVIEEDKLRWPDGIGRTPIQSRVKQGSWKRTRHDYHNGLIDELRRMGATSILICRAENERLDPGVAVWFSMKKEDFSWQKLLGLENPAPSLDEIDAAFRTKAARCHPDRPDGGDPSLFKVLNEARQQAKAWVQGTHSNRHEYVMAIDQYNEARLNLHALKLAFAALRTLERVGAPAILSQTLGAFRAKLTGGSDGQ